MTNKYWQVVFLVSGVVSIHLAIHFFPVPKIWSLENFIGEIFFSPFKLFIASFSFIIGFLSLSLVISLLLRFGQVTIFTRRKMSWQRLMISCIFCVFIYLIINGGIIGGLAVLLSIIYGIMDGGLRPLQRKKRQERG